MKRAIRILVVTAFALFGCVYIFLVPVFVGWLLHAKGVQEYSEDEVGRGWALYLLTGAPVFALLWGWIGRSLTQNLLQGLLRAAGAMAAAVLFYFTWGIFVPEAVGPYWGIAFYTLSWCLLSWLCAYAAGKLASRRPRFLPEQNING